MYAIIPRILLIALCAITAYKGGTADYLIALLITFAISSISFAAGRKSVTYTLCLVYLVMGIIIPTQALYYLPVIIFEISQISLHIEKKLPVIDKSLIPSIIGMVVVALCALSYMLHLLSAQIHPLCIS